MWYFKQLTAKTDNDNDNDNDNKLYKRCNTGCFREKYSETFRPTVWESKYLSSNMQIVFEKPNAST